MGYIPPDGPSATALIRADMEPMLLQLYHIYSVTAELGRSGRPRETGYRKYIDDLYGHRPADHWFLFLNYSLLALLVALPATILWGVLGGA